MQTENKQAVYRVRYGGPGVEERKYPRSQSKARHFLLWQALEFAQNIMGTKAATLHTPKDDWHWTATWAVVERAR